MAGLNYVLNLSIRMHMQLRIVVAVGNRSAGGVAAWVCRVTDVENRVQGEPWSCCLAVELIGARLAVFGRVSPTAA